MKKGESREQAIIEIAFRESVGFSKVTESQREKPQPQHSVDYLHEKIADARARESISWVSALVGVIVLLAGIVLLFYKERNVLTGQTSQPYSQIAPIIALIGFFTLLVAGGWAIDYRDEKAKYLKELEGLGLSRNVCPKCGREISPDFKICPYCETKLK